jgi:hypothetical protein
MTVLRTGEFFEPEVGWLGMGVLLCDLCDQRVETSWDVITDALAGGDWESYRQRDEDGGVVVVHVCPKCRADR